MLVCDRCMQAALQHGKTEVIDADEVVPQKGSVAHVPEPTSADHTPSKKKRKMEDLTISATAGLFPLHAGQTGDATSTVSSRLRNRK